MNFIVDFIKDIFMINPEKTFVGLAGIKVVNKSEKKLNHKSHKKSETKLSDLMRKNYKKLKV